VLAKKRILIILFTVSFMILGSVYIMAEENITLQLWDDYSGASRDPVVKAAIAQFEERHPNITIKRTGRPLDEISTMIMAAVPEGHGPDIMTVNAGEQLMGPLVRGGHLLSLEPYAGKYNWYKKLLSPAILDRGRYTADGTSLGEGNLYGIGFDGQLVGVYYNKDIFQELNLKVPESIPEFENAMEKIRAAGIDPIAISGLHDYRFFHLYGLIQASVLAHNMGADEAQRYLDDIVLHWKEDRSWINASNIEAARIVQKWVENDYFIEGFSGLKGSDDLALFTAGKTAMFVQGSWYSSDVAAADFNTGFFPFPPYSKGEELPPQIGGMTTPIGINKHTEYPDLAGEFIDILLSSEETRKIQQERSVLPAQIPVDLSEIEGDTLYYDMLVTWNEVNEAGNMAHFLDWTTPTMWDTLAESGRELLALKISPEEFVNIVEEDYRAWLSKKPGK